MNIPFTDVFICVMCNRDDPVRDPEEPPEESCEEENYTDDEVSEETEEDICLCGNCPSRAEYGDKVTCCMQISNWQRKYLSEG